MTAPFVISTKWDTCLEWITNWHYPELRGYFTLKSLLHSELKQVMSLFTLGSARAVRVVALVYSFPDVFNVIMALISPYTNLLLSPSDGLASFLKTTLANGVKVVKKVITSKFRFHLIAIYALGCFRNFSCTSVPTKSTLKSLNLNDKKQLIWKLLIYWYLMSFFHKKMSQNVWATIMPFGPVTLIFYWPKKNISGQHKTGPHFRHCYYLDKTCPWTYRR